MPRFPGLPWRPWQAQGHRPGFAFSLDRPAARPSAWADFAARGLVSALVGIVLLTAAATPALAQAGVASLAKGSAAHACQD